MTDDAYVLIVLSCCIILLGLCLWPDDEQE